MPIARPVSGTISTGQSTIVPGASCGSVIPSAGYALALDGLTFRLANATAAGYGGLFVGFSNTLAGIGDNVTFLSGRGAVVLPVIEGGGSLTVSAPVYLSMTPGMVTSTPITPGAGRIIRIVGSAISTTQMILVSDFYSRIPG